MTVAVLLYDAVVAPHVLAQCPPSGCCSHAVAALRQRAGAPRAHARLLGVVVTRAASLDLVLGAYLATESAAT